MLDLLTWQQQKLNGGKLVGGLSKNLVNQGLVTKSLNLNISWQTWQV